MSVQSRYDVITVGAGAAGVCAAVAAARAGAGSLLVEQGSRLGGAVTAAMHRSLCGLYSTIPASPEQTLNLGPQRDVVSRMLQISPGQVQVRAVGRAIVLEFPAAAWVSALQQMCSDAGVAFRPNTRVLGVRQSRSRVSSVELAGEHSEVFSPRALIDCTGGGAVLGLIGESLMQPADAPGTEMLGGYSVRWAGLAGESESLRLQVPYELARAVRAGELPAFARFSQFFPGSEPGEGVLKLAIPPAELDSTRLDGFVSAVLDKLRQTIPNFGQAMVIETSPGLLRRDGRRLLGRETVTEEMVLQGRKISADAVHACWPVEFWDTAIGPSYRYPPPGEHYDIPDGAMRSDRTENLFAAGICLSATQAAAASTRAAGICLATGARAGLLAASD